MVWLSSGSKKSIGVYFSGIVVVGRERVCLA